MLPILLLMVLPSRTTARLNAAHFSAVGVGVTLPILLLLVLPSTSRTGKLDACTETHVSRLYAGSGKIVETKNRPIESRLFARGRGKTEWSRALSIPARTHGVEAASLSWSTASPKVVPRTPSWLLPHFCTRSQEALGERAFFVTDY